MDAHYDKEFRQAFVVDEEELTRITAILSKYVGATAFTADCSDDVTRDFDSLESLLDYDNSKKRQIRRIRIFASSSDLTTRVHLSMSSTGLRGISLQIDGPDSTVVQLREKVLDIIQGLVPWYSFLSRIDIVLLVFGAYSAFWLFVLAIIAFGLEPTTDSQPAQTADSIRVFFIMVGPLLFLGIISYLLHRFRDAVFPFGSFLIGQGKRRYGVTEKLQWVVVIGFLVSLAAGGVLISR